MKVKGQKTFTGFAGFLRSTSLLNDKNAFWNMNNYSSVF